jgi:crossover junction endodeoxyribonuclease RuvC
MTVILGIDPGSQTTGYGIIQSQVNQVTYVHSGYLRLKDLSLAQKMHTICASLIEVMHDYQVDEVAIEQVFMHANPGSALKLGQARGAAIVAVGKQQLLLAEYTARQIKQSVVGYGAADKTQVQHMVKLLLNMSQRVQADEADGLATALCHAHFRRGSVSLLAGRKQRRGRLR